MNSHQQAHEAYVQVLIKQRHTDAIKAEQVRMAQHGQPRRIPSLSNRIRVSIGTVLISAGERIRHTPVETTAGTVLKRSV